MLRRRLSFFLVRASAVAAALAATLAAAEPSRAPLRLLGEDQPRAFFFRQTEGLAAQQRMPYEQWDRSFSTLMGVMGKVLDEEVPGRSRGLATFVRFKRDHPEQAVLLHVNGNSRDPRYEGGRFFAGHWLYYNGATLQDNLPAVAGESTVRVSDPRLFETGGGRYKNANDDIGLCELGADGRPDWSRAEQVQLLAVDRAAGTIRIRRGAFGTAPRAFAAGRAYAAAHAAEGPWGADSHLLWNYNYATTCPRDARGRNAAEVFVAHLAELFTGAGPLATFDGLEFDVLFNEPNGARRPSRGADCDADGRRDNGVIGGVNVYGQGVTEFCRQLRAALGDGKLLLADGAFRRDNEQRATASLNGIESEGWPVLGDFKIDDWSGGLNRHAFWAAFAHRPVLNYANVKFVEAGEAPGNTRQAAVPAGSVRLAFAGAVFTDSAITFSHRAAGGVATVWDELVAGREQRVGWLGRARGPARHLADAAPDLLGGAAPLRGAALRSRLGSSDATISQEGESIRLSAKQAAAVGFEVRLAGLSTTGGDLCVVVKGRSAAMRGTPPETARMIRVAVAPKNTPKASSAEIMSWLGRDDFASRFYFRTSPAAGADVILQFESSEPVWLSELVVRAAPDRVVREFEHGAVLANPADTPQTFDLGALWPGRAWRRLRATEGQDAQTNNGETVGAQVTLPPRDALFLLAAPAGG
jgi:hypothetical protein